MQYHKDFYSKKNKLVLSHLQRSLAGMPYEGVLRSLGHDITSEQQHLLGEIRETFPSITEKSEILNFLLNAGKREKPECLIGALGEAAIECKGLNPRDRANSKKRMSVLAKHWEQFK